MSLLSSFGKQGETLGLLTLKADIEDTAQLSKYFALTEFDPVFTAGKNSVAFNGSNLLKDKSEVKVECIDSHGNSLYMENARAINSQFTDASKFVLAVHIYEEVYNGPGKLILVGTTVRGEIVRWIGNITIDKTLDNSSKVRFYYKPTLEIRPLLYPLIDTGVAQTIYPPLPATRGATAIATITGKIEHIEITNGGRDYTYAQVGLKYGPFYTQWVSADVVVDIYGSIISLVITGQMPQWEGVVEKIGIRGDGYGAFGTPVKLNQVASIILQDGGIGYTYNPVVTITGVAGTGATATATVFNSVVTSVELTNSGSGYTAIPTVNFEVPPYVPPAILNVPVSFTGSFYTYATNPLRDADKFTLNAKQTEVDYRLILSGSTDDFKLDSPTFPSNSFNSQMEGQTINLNISEILLPFSYQTVSSSITQSFTIKKVKDNKTIQLSEPFYYADGKNEFVAHITKGTFNCLYDYVLYNTNPDSVKKIKTSPTETVNVEESHAEITYRNLRTYSGFVARHKLYRKSAFAPGDFQLISDELLGSLELLQDTVTFNKFYDRMGVFYNQLHVDKYWFTSSNAISVQAQSSPLNSMKISGSNPTTFDGHQYVIIKNDSTGGINDNIYYPYNEIEFNRQSGSSYNANFVPLKKDALYALSFNVTMEKEALDTTANVAFYFTSSIPSIKLEKSYESPHGLKLGAVSTTDKTAIKYFTDKQVLYFTPTNDYYGTLVVIPYHCNVILSDISLKLYGDHGFSPDILFIRIPFPLKVANEAFNLKAELLDINSNVVYSNITSTQTFDTIGASLNGAGVSNLNAVISVVPTDGTTPPTVVVTGTPYLPDLAAATDLIRFVGWHIPTDVGEKGKLCYTNVSQLFIDSDEYIVLNSYESGIEHIAKSVAVRYDFSVGQGRKIVVNTLGVKESFP